MTTLTIPRQSAILDRALDLRADAQRQHDASAVKAFDSLIVGVVCGYAQLRWEYQYLLVASATTPGMIYQVSHASCTCEARKPCWHQRLRALLIDMFETEAETADMEADAGEPVSGYGARFLSCGLPNPLFRIQEAERVAKIVAARRSCWASL